jgi:hypothetical protein
MDEYKRTYPMQGYILLPPSDVAGYLGVDRKPFVLMYPLELPNIGTTEPIWKLHWTDWERRAYQLLEENLVTDPQGDLDLIDNLEVAKAVRNILELHLSTFDIVHCKVWDIGNPNLNPPEALNPDFLGYDVAYGGGDYYSAIKSGLFTIDDDFTQKYKPLLNENGLFSSLDIIDEYISEYRKIVPSEVDGLFDIFELELVSESDE